MRGIHKTLLGLALALVTCLYTLPSMAAPAIPFDQWLASLRQDAIKAGISYKVLDDALTGIKPDPEVIRLDMPKNQAEFAESFTTYAGKRVSRARIDKGRKMLLQHYDSLQRISKRYGVAPQYIVALWGMETNYGSYTGNKDIIRSLATLAWHGRDGTSPNRAAFFRKELIAALKIINQGHFAPREMKGSWAGAFGQVQFMPTSFINLARDGDGDGKKDIRNNLMDAFASAANYLAENGWNPGQRWGREVRLPAGFDAGLVNTRKPLAAWKRLGLKTVAGEAVPVVPGMQATLLAPDGLSGPTYLVYNNFHTIKRWNNSDSFALSVGLLANAIAAAVPSGRS